MIRQAVMWPGLGCAVATLVACFAWAGAEQEEVLTIDQVPAAVQATILAEAAGGQVREIEREMRGGVAVYEAEIFINGVETDVLIAEDGTVLGREVEGDDDDGDDEGDDEDAPMDPQKLPEAVRATLTKLTGGATLIEAGSEVEQGVTVYEAAWMADGHRHEAQVLADGTLLEWEDLVSVDGTPPAVKTAIGQHFANATDLVVVRKMIVVYEVEGKVNGREKERYIMPTGKVHDGDDDGDDDDGDDDDDDDGDDD